MKTVGNLVTGCRGPCIAVCLLFPPGPRSGTTPPLSLSPHLYREMRTKYLYPELTFYLLLLSFHPIPPLTGHVDGTYLAALHDRVLPTCSRHRRKLLVGS